MKPFLIGLFVAALLAAFFVYVGDPFPASIGGKW
jgi:hypothetical protein